MAKYIATVATLSELGESNIVEHEGRQIALQSVATEDLVESVKGLINYLVVIYDDGK